MDIQKLLADLGVSYEGLGPSDLRQEKGKLLAQVKAIQKELDAPDCDFTAEQREKREAKQDDLLAGAEGLETMAAEQEAREAASRERAKKVEELSNAGATGRRSRPADPNVTSVEVSEPGFTRDPMKGFATPREYFRAVMSHRSDAHPHDAKDERLRYLAAAGSDEQQAGSDPYGGFLVPEGMSPGVETLTPEDDPFAGRTSPMPMDTVTVKVNARVDKNHTSSVSGGLSVNRKAETAAAAASRTQFDQVTFHANSLFGFGYATEELLRDSPSSVAAIMEQGFREEFRSNHIIELLRGTGVGEFEGVQNNPALISVSKETGQAADSIVYENLIKMRARCWRYSQAIWLYNHDALVQLMTLVLPIGTGGVPMWQMSAIEGQPDRILGRPAIASEYMETVGDLHDIMLIVPSEIREGTYQPLESAESIHVRFDRHERAFKFWLRNDARSLWRTALTPNKSSDTLSPFVTLAARA